MTNKWTLLCEKHADVGNFQMTWFKWDVKSSMEVYKVKKIIYSYASQSLQV